LEELRDIQKLCRNAHPAKKSVTHVRLKHVIDEVCRHMTYSPPSSSSLKSDGPRDFRTSPEFESFVKNGVLSATLEVTAGCCILHVQESSQGHYASSHCEEFMERMAAADVMLPNLLYSSVLKLLVVLAGLDFWMRQVISRQESMSDELSSGIPSKVLGQILCPEAHIILLAAISSFKTMLKAKNIAPPATGDNTTTLTAEEEMKPKATDSEQAVQFYLCTSDLFLYLNELAPLLCSESPRETSLLDYPFYLSASHCKNSCSSKVEKDNDWQPPRWLHAVSTVPADLAPPQLPSAHPSYTSVTEQSAARRPHYENESVSVSEYNESMAMLLQHPLSGVSALKTFACLVEGCAEAMDNALLLASK
jgi:hypothetical protein